MARKKITAQQIDDLFVDAVGGDSEAEGQLRDLVRTLAKRSNQQMLEQERREITCEAWRRAQDFLGGSEEQAARFKESTKNIDLEALKEEADALLRFQGAKDYSIPYAVAAKEQIEKNYDALKAAGIDPEDERVAFWMNELFKTDAWKEYKKAHGKSTNLIHESAEQFRQGKTVDDLLAAYEDYQSGRDDAPDLVESWEIFAPDGWN